MQVQQSATHMTRSVRETLTLAETLGRLLKGGELICLQGELGTGKTCLVQGIAKGMGIHREIVTSPTFTLHHEYSGKLQLHHLDFYRLDQPEEIERLGLLDLLDHPQSVVIVEWADRDGGLLPKERLQVRIDWEAETVRRFELYAVGSHYCNLLREFESRIQHPKGEH
jgi:tRNA threonylcarbamoyladenosine biosynthesis protein TsaE